MKGIVDSESKKVNERMHWRKVEREEVIGALKRTKVYSKASELDGITMETLKYGSDICQGYFISV